MANIEWKYVSPLKEGTEVDVIELKYHYRIPDDLKDYLVNKNAGVPSPSFFDMENKKDMVFGGLLSFNAGDVDCFNDYVVLFEEIDKKGLKMFPFALDPAGNFFCIKDNKVVLYNHEMDSTHYICDTFTDLLKMLHD